ncbi:MAG: FkbM family methyltransferase [Candidatus Poribacteria bacterium]|nr:FkbM family methyltransferase [Candidatus Poribacteria bacterium]
MNVTRFEILVKTVDAVRTNKRVREEFVQFETAKYPVTTVECSFGFKLTALANNSTVHTLLQTTGFSPYEPFNTYVSVVAASQGGMYFDIGANVGYYGLLAAHMSNKRIQVYAFEPGSESYRFLTRNVRDNELGKRVTPYQLGIGDVDDFGEFSKYGTGASMVRGWDGGKGDELGTETIRIARLDSLFSPSSLTHPVTVKIDVEGAEFSVLQGGQAFFNSPKVSCVLCEVTHSQHPGGINPRAVESLEMLGAFGFDCFGAKGSIPSVNDSLNVDLVPFEDVRNAPPNEWPSDWVCVRRGDTIGNLVLASNTAFPLFYSTYHRSNDYIVQWLLDRGVTFD